MKSLIKKIFSFTHASNIILIIIITVLALLFLLPIVFATLEEKRIEEIDVEKIQINKDIKNYENDIILAKINLKEVKKDAATSWASVLEISIAEDKIIQAQANYTSSMNELKSLLQEESDLIKIISELEENEEESPPSNLTKRLGIIISNSCIIMIINNFETDCPSYEDLFILDNSNTDWSGKFITDDNGFFHRGDPPIYNTHKLYQFDDEIRIFIDPPYPDRYKLITIIPNLDTYIKSSDITQDGTYNSTDITFNGTFGNDPFTVTHYDKVLDFGRIIYHDRYVKNCNSAVIGAEDWKILLVDTINFLRNDCDKQFTTLDVREVILTNYTSIDHATSSYYQAQWKLEADIIRCKVLC